MILTMVSLKVACLGLGFFQVDDVSLQLLQHILGDEEHHVDWIEGQLHQIQEVGYENYLAQQIFKTE